MSVPNRFTTEEQLRALRRIAAQLRDSELDVLALGSAAVVLRTGQRETITKDLDLHAFPVEDVLAFEDAIQDAVQRLGGHMHWEPDGASITARIPVGGRDIPVEFVLGREDFIEPEVLADAVNTSEERDGLLVPSWEHIVAMKAEAWFDRTGREKRKYLEDLRGIRGWLEEGTGEKEENEETYHLERTELRRIVGMRPGRKHRDMLLTIERIFEGLIQ